MPAIDRPGGTTALKVKFRRVSGSHHRVGFKKRDGQKRDIRQVSDPPGLNAHGITPGTVNTVLTMLKNKELQGFFSEGRNVKIKGLFPEFRMVK